MEVKLSNSVLNSLLSDFLVIKLSDNNKYWANKNFIQRFVLNKWIKQWGSPIIISEKRVDYNVKELKKIILTNKSKK